MTASVGFDTSPAEAQGATEFVFQGRGWGHGVGMSQNGARNAAEAGVDHVGILNQYYPNAVIGQPGTIDNIRVHIGDASRVELTSAGSIVFERGGVAIQSIPSGTISISAHDGGLQVGDAWTTGSAAEPLMVSFPQPVTVSNNGHRYLWGRLQLTNKNGKVRVVEVLPLEQYVAGIAEMPAAWPLEALMAQAIAARTYAHEVTLHRRNSLEWAQEYDISGTTVDQNYIGYDAQDSAWDQKWLAAVSATAGVELIDANGPIRAYYSASNGGYTETAAYVFENDVPYTVAGPDPWDEGGHDWTEWTRTYSQESMSRWFNAYDDTAVGTLTAINVLGGAGASARLDKAVIELVGTAGTKRVTGKRMMVVMNAGIFGEGGGLSRHLPGTFTTIGNGAGVGLPQPTGAAVVATATPDPVASDVDENEGFTPPPGWEPEPGTGVAPNAPTGDAEAPQNTGVPAEGDAGVDSADFVPPEGWTPEPGTGVAPNAPAADGAAPDSSADADGEADFVPPDDWTPEPGAGVAPNAAATDAAPAADGQADGDADGDFVPPEDWEPEPGTGVEPATETSSADATPGDAAASDATPGDDAASDDAVIGGTGGGTEYVPPADWRPEPGTGVAPTAQASGVQTSGVLLVTRTADATELTETDFEIVAPTSELAEEARARLEELQARAALGLFAEVDADGYVSSVAPRPVHGVCTATADGVTCVPLAALQDD